MSQRQLSGGLAGLQALHPVEFERLVKNVFERLGYEVKMTRWSGDEGVDLVLEKDDERSIAQCKRYRGQIGQAALRDFYGTVVHENAKRGFFVTTGVFSLPCHTWAAGKNLVLVDGTDLIEAANGLGVSLPSEPSIFSPLPALTDAIRDANQGSRPLFLLFIGPPPSGRSYREVGQALEDHIKSRAFRYFAPKGAVSHLYERKDRWSRYKRVPLLFDEDLTGDRLTHQIDHIVAAKIGERSFFFDGAPLRFHYGAGVWNPKATFYWRTGSDSPRRRERDQRLREAGCLEVPVHTLDWNDLDRSLGADS